MISSGLDTPSAWNTTLYVCEDRVDFGVVAFNTRSYCFMQDGEKVCSNPGPTIELVPGDNLTLLLVNELGSTTAVEGQSYFIALSVVHGFNV